ncbi:MAG: shikimate dehydrogenase, partial [Buchnera aphidicola]|nr:shikimate dehydrogenase [Buchnera aphidicola]
GATRGILFPLLSFGCSVFILNRTVLHAKNLVIDFKKYGNIYLFDKMCNKLKSFDLIINATTRDSIIKEDFLPHSLISSQTCFYDMNYGLKSNDFISWFLSMGGVSYSDGVGMLVFQAAHSCFLWHNRFPLVNYIIKILEKK